jgi:hypothetical protein
VVGGVTTPATTFHKEQSQMKRFSALIALLAFIALGTWAVTAKAVVYNYSQPVHQQVIGFASGAAQSNTATLTGVAGEYTYIEGFDLTGGGATAASIIEVTTTGINGSLPKFEVAIAAGVTAPAFSTTGSYTWSIRFPTPLRSTATNTNITVVVPSYGSGNTNASVIAYGFTAP